ncbi:restriction endonuclease subunit S [Lactobacillus johnsonii]
MGEHIIVSKQKNKDNLSLPAFSISNKNGFIPQEEQFGKDNTYSKTDKSSNYIVKPKYFAYNPARINVGSIAYQNTITPVLVSSLYEIFRSDNNIDDVFLQYWFRSEYFYKQIQRLQEGGVRQYFFIDKMRESQIYLTNVSEQNKIGSIISKLDKLLTLQQRKVTLFKQLKGSLLDSLISGKDTPLVRFNEFKSKWTLFTLKDIVTKTIKGSAKAEMHGKESIYLDTHYLNGGNPSMVNSPTNVSSNDIIILWDGSQAGKVYHGFTGALGSTLKSYTPKYSSDYLFQYLKKYQNKIFANYRTPNIPHVIKDFATVFKVNLPSTKEQIIISSLLKTLDVQITTENTSVNHLKNIKQFLLQNVFI